MTKKIYILYHPGSYGSYVRWLLEYANDMGHRFRHIPDNPLLADGSSHNMITLPNEHPRGMQIISTLDETVDEPCGYKIYRALPVVDENNTTDDIIDKLVQGKSADDRVIYIDVNGQDAKDLIYLNFEQKTDYKDSFTKNLQKHVHRFDVNAGDFWQLDRWQQRELLSLYYPGMINSLIKSPQYSSHVLYVDMYDILHGNVHELCSRLLQHCQLQPRPNCMSQVTLMHEHMLHAQSSMAMLQHVREIMHACLHDLDLVIREQTLFSESMIQHYLRLNGFEMRCYQLDDFPKTVSALRKLTYAADH